MTQFRLLLSIITVGMAAYTLAVIAQDGINLLPHFLSPIFALTWQGQFNADFSIYLLLAGLWIAWRGGFTGGSIALAVVSACLGILLLAPYLIVLINRTGGNAEHLLMGVHARSG